MDIFWIVSVALATIILVGICIATIAGTVASIVIFIKYLKEKLYEH